MALTAYEAGNFAEAKNLFEQFVSTFKDSVYTPHAYYFLRRIE